MTLRITVMALAMMLATPAFAQSGHEGHGAHMQAMPTHSKAAPARATPAQTAQANGTVAAMLMKHGQHGVQTDGGTNGDMGDIMARMHRDMDLPLTGDADADFIRGMIPHHQGAVEMARYELAHGDDPEARELARRIIVAQKGEIAWMRRWLEYRQIPERGEFRFND